MNDMANTTYQEMPKEVRGEILINADGQIEVRASSAIQQAALSKIIYDLRNLKEEDRVKARLEGKEEALKIITRNLLEELLK